MNITIIGAGHSGFTAAAALQDKNCSILLYTRKKEKACRLNKNGITLSGSISGHRVIPMTDDLEKAVRSADVILVDTWANAHRSVFRSLRSLLQKDQILLILNSNWGAYEAWQILREEALAKHITIGETSSQIFLGHLQYDSDVLSTNDPSNSSLETRIPVGLTVNAVKQHMSVAGITKADTRRIIRTLDGILAQLTPSDSIFATSLSSANPIIHAPLSLFHLSQIENKEQFLFLSSTSQSVLDYVEKMDEERSIVAAMLHTQTIPVLQEMNRFWNADYKSLADIFQHNPAYCSLPGPTSLQHRFITEDIPFGSYPVADLAKLFGKETPYTDALLQVYHMLLHNDYQNEKVQFRKEEIETLLTYMEKENA